MARIGKVFKESDSDAMAMIVIEGDKQLGDDAHHYYQDIIGRLKADPKDVQHIQDFWGDPLTAAGAQSPDGKAAYVQLNLVGNQGETSANSSVAAVRKIVDSVPAPKGVKAYVTGSAAVAADGLTSGDKTIVKIMITTVAVIFVMLLFVYRSFITVALLLAMVGVELAAARGIVAFLALHDVIRLSTFATNMLVSLAIAAGTDYGIFFIGRYHEARHNGEDRRTAYLTAYRGVAHVVLASGLTIAGATYCLSFARLPVFQTVGAPCAVGMLVAVAVALTLIPAVIAVGSRFGLLEPKRLHSVRGWRRVGTAVVRWPAPIFAATCAVAMVGLLALPGYKVSYIDRDYIPKDTPGNVGMAAAERHFSQARMMPEILMVESDHDMRNSADFLILDKLAKSIFRVEGIARVQSITRPQGTPLEHTSIPFLLSMQNAGQLQNLQVAKGRLDDMSKLADQLGGTIKSLERVNTLMNQMVGTTHHVAGVTKDTLAITNEVRDNIADFDDTFRPLRSYFYADPHCYNIPMCWGIRSAYNATDGVDKLSEKLGELTKDIDSVDAVVPQLVALLPPQIETMRSLRTMVLTMHSTMSGMFDQANELSDDATAMGKDFDAAKTDDSFYLPHEVFANPDFQRVEKLFLSPDGKAARFIISHKGDPATPEGMSRIDAIKTAAYESLKGTRVGGCQGLHLWHRSNFQGSAGSVQLRLHDRGHLVAVHDLHHHAAHHAQSGGRAGDRGHGRLVAGRFVRDVGAVVAVHPRGQAALARDGDVGDHPVGRRFRLQPVAGRAVQGGDRRRPQDGHHPGHGWHRSGRDGRGPGVRVHHGVDDGQRQPRGRSGGHHHRSGSAVRHVGGAVVPDAVHRRDARPLVLVADERRVASAADAAAGGARAGPHNPPNPTSPRRWRRLATGTLRTGRCTARLRGR